MKKIIAAILAVITLLSVFSVTISAASYSTDYKSYPAPTRTLYYTKTTLKGNDVRYFQCAINYLISRGKLSTSKLNVDGSFGPACKTATIAFQRAYGLSADGSFGPASRNKMALVLRSLTESGNTSTSVISKTLSVNMRNITSTGYQPNSGPCGCYAVAYARDILDNRAHSWTDFSVSNSPSWNTYQGVRSYRYSYTVSWSKGNCTLRNGRTAQEVYRAMYDSINNGKPVVVRVTGNGSTGHYITIVGYQNVTNVNSLSPANFLMIDPVRSLFNMGITSMRSGSTGYSLASNLQYAIVN